MISRNPNLAELLKVAFANQIEGVHTAIPGKIVSYDSSTQSASVQPLIQNTVTPDEGEYIAETMPVINKVHVIFPRTAGLFISFGIAVGDMGMLIFSEKSMDVWSGTDGGITDPLDTRRHDLADAVFLPGVFPFPKALQNADTQGVKMGSDAAGGMRVEITDGNGFVITMANGQTLTVKGEAAGATMTLGDGAMSVAVAEQMQILWEALTTYLSTLILPVMGPKAGPPIVPPLPILAWLPTINSSSTKIPG